MFDLVFLDNGAKMLLKRRTLIVSFCQCMFNNTTTTTTINNNNNYNNNNNFI